MAATIVGSALDFGVSDDEASLVTQSVSITNNSDMKEVKDKGGDTVTVAFYNKKSDISIEGYGSASNVPGATLTLSAGTSGDVVGTVFIKEVTIDKSNEDFVKSSISAIAYAGIA